MDLDSDETQSSLTKDELSFARNFKSAKMEHFKVLALNHMPGDFGQLDPKKIEPKLPKPNKDSAVFIKGN